MGRSGPQRVTHTIDTHRALILLAALSLLVMSLVFAPVSFWPAAFVCLVPWLILIGRSTQAPRVYFYSFLWSLAFFLINMRWLYYATGLGYAALSFYQALYFPLMACALRSAIMRRRWPLAIVFPLVWTGSEMLRAVVISGFPWFYLSHGMSNLLPLIQVSDLVGAYGVSFLVASVNGLIADVVMARWFSSEKESERIEPRKLVAGAVCCVVLWAASLGYGVYRLGSDEQVTGPKVAVLQGDFINTVEGNEESPQEKRELYFSMLDEAAKDKPDLFLLPETPWYMYLNKEMRDFSRLFLDSFAMFRDRAVRYSAYIITGSATSIPTPGSLLAKDEQYNSATIFSPYEIEPLRYDKVHLVYFGEIVPFRFGRLRPLYFWLNSLMPFSGGGEREFSLFPGKQFLRFGMSPTSQPGESYRFGVPICYEDVMPYVARRFSYSGDGEKKVDFLLNISNDGWFGRGIQQPQHLAICVFRAVENRVGIARAVNTGMSGFIEPSGRLHDLVKRDPSGRWPGQCGYAVASLKVNSRLTFYSKHGDWFAWSCAAVWLLLFGDYWSTRARHGYGWQRKWQGMTVMRAFSMFVLLAGGCRSAGSVRTSATPRQLEYEARECLRLAVSYQSNPVVRVGAIEALQGYGGADVVPWIRTALLDDLAAVRFAGCLALGALGDSSSAAIVRDRLKDVDPNVRVAALYALHRFGDESRSGFLPQYLLNNEDAAVRRNAAFVLGRLGEPGAIKVIARAMKDEDRGVRQNALEAMARLGNAEAQQELLFMASSGLGTEEVFAIQALAQTGEARFIDMFRYKLGAAAHVETKLAAARALGMLGKDDGYDLAIRALRQVEAGARGPDDTPAGKLLRIHQAAATALGAIGRNDALSALSDMMRDPSDPREQVSAAGAILMILKRGTRADSPFSVGLGRRGG